MLIRTTGSALALVLTAAATAAGPVIGPAAHPDDLPADLAPLPARMAPALRPIIEDALFRSLSPRHQLMLNVMAAQRAAERGPVVACFAPGTSSETMSAFSRAIFAFQDRFTPGPRWESTATNGPTGADGDPIVLTYSFVPDGTVIRNGVGEGVGSSDLFARMAVIYAGNTAQWQALYHGVFARWGELTGITYIYEPNDDGVDLVDAPGITGVRGDLRLAGKPIDGNSGVLAYNYYPDSGDMVIDTNDNFFENTANNSLALRNVLSHEHGHGMGQPHVCPVQSTKLMEPFASTAFDGPRHDDIRGAHARYGDINEPNASSAQATPLGTVATGSSFTFGLPPAPAIPNGATFSIHADGDEDWYSFSTGGTGLLSIAAIPAGLIYEDAPQSCSGFSGSCCFGEFTDSAAMANLTIDLYSSSGSLISSADFSLPGAAESLFASLPAGSYLLRVAENGPVAEPQLYTLNLGLAASPALAIALSEPLPPVIGPAGSITISVRAAAAPAGSIAMSLRSRRGNSGTFATTPMTSLGNGLFSATLPAQGCGPDWQYYVQASIPGASASLPASAPSSIYSTAVGSPVTLFSDSFETSPGWTVTGTATAGAWTHGEPLGTGAQPELDHSPDPLQNCYFTGQGTVATSAGEADVDNGSTTLTSNAFSALGVNNPTIGYWRWYDNSRGGAPNADVFTVELSSDNGSSWITAAIIGPNTNNNGNWLFHEIPLASVAGITPSASMRIRFTASDLGTGSLVEAAIDDFSVYGLECTQTCPADYNNDSGVDGDDVIAFFADWDAGNTGADFNNDGGVDGDDVIVFFAAWDSGC